MDAQTAPRTRGAKPKLERVRRRTPRPGRRRTKTLVFVHELLTRLEVYAAKRGMNVVDVIMDWIEQRIPAEPRARRGSAAVQSAEEPETPAAGGDDGDE